MRKNLVTSKVITGIALAAGLLLAPSFGASAVSLSLTPHLVKVGDRPEGVAVNEAKQKIYVTNSGSDSVSVVDAATNTVTATIPVGSAPSAAAVDEATQSVYVTNGGSDSVSVIDAATDAVTATIPVGSQPNSVAVYEAKQKVYVTNSGSDSVSVIDAAAGDVKKTVPVGRTPNSIAIDEWTNKIYVANKSKNSFVSVINGSLNAVTATIPAGDYPSSVAINKLTHKVYIASPQIMVRDGVFLGNVLSVVDGVNDTVTKRISLTLPLDYLAVDQSNQKIYTANTPRGSSTPNMMAIDAATYSYTVHDVSGLGPGGMYGLAINQANHQLYAPAHSAEPWCSKPECAFGALAVIAPPA